MSGNLSRGGRIHGLLLLGVLAAWAGGPLEARAATPTVKITNTVDDAMEQGNNVRHARERQHQRVAQHAGPRASTTAREASVSPASPFPRDRPSTARPCAGTSHRLGLDDIDCTIYGNARDNASDFAVNPYILATVAEPNGRPRTAANVPVSRLNMGSGQEDFDVTSIVQELVNRPGWTSGNAVALLLIPVLGTAYNTDFYDVSGGIPANTAELLLDYTPPSITLAEHGSGQIPDQFTTFPTVNDAPLFRFRLSNSTGAPVPVDTIAFRLSAVWKVFSADVTDLRINDGSVDVATGGVATIGGRTGAIHFGADWAIPASSTMDYTLTGDVKGLAAYDTITVSLQVGDITLAAGTKAGVVASRARHLADSALGRLNVIYSNKVALGAPNNLEYSLFSTTWSPTPGVVGVNDIPDSLWWKTLITKPDFSQQAAVAMTDGGGGRPRLHASFWDGTSWNYGTTTPLQDSYDVAAPTTGWRRLQPDLRGRVRVGQRTPGDRRGQQHAEHHPILGVGREPWVRNYVVESPMSVNGWFQWTKLASIPGTNKVAFIGTCSAPSSGDGSVAIWDGDTNTWTSKSGIGLTVNNVLGQAFDMTTVRGGPNAREVLAAYGQS